MLHNRCIVRNSNNSGLNIVAWAFNFLSTTKDLSSLFLNLLKSLQIVVYRLLAVKRSNESIGVKRATNLEFRVSSDHTFDKSVIN